MNRVRQTHVTMVAPAQPARINIHAGAHTHIMVRNAKVTFSGRLEHIYLFVRCLKYPSFSQLFQLMLLTK